MAPRSSSQNELRTLAALSKEMSRAWYQCRSYPDHPGRLNVEPMIRDKVVAELRNGLFDFWRDLVPPFIIVKVTKDSELSSVKADYIRVKYSCGLDYRSERSIYRGKDWSTFDNLISGTALIRLPPRYQGHGVQVLHWGRPFLMKHMIEEEDASLIRTTAAGFRASTLSLRSCSSTSTIETMPEGTKLLKRCASAPLDSDGKPLSYIPCSKKKRLPQITKERLPFKEQCLSLNLRTKFPYLYPC